MQNQKLLKLKIEFNEKQFKKEQKQLAKLTDKYRHYSDYHGSSSPFHWTHHPSENDVRKATHDHKCGRSVCKKIVKKGDFYYRRSFGKMWTIKACSIKCFCFQLP